MSNGEREKKVVPAVDSICESTLQMIWTTLGNDCKKSIGVHWIVFDVNLGNVRQYFQCRQILQ